MTLAETLSHGALRASGCTKPKPPGAIVAAGANRGPAFRVIAVVDDQAWVRPLDGGPDAIVAIERLRLVED